MTSHLERWDILIRRYSVPLILGIIIGITHANISPESYHYLFASHIEDKREHFILFPKFKLFGEYYITLSFIINDCFMLYFFIVAFFSSFVQFLETGINTSSA